MYRKPVTQKQIDAKKASDKKYNEAHKDEIKKYRQANKDNISKAHKLWVKRNKTEINRKRRIYLEANKEYISKRQKAYRIKNKEKTQKTLKKYRSNPEVKVRIKKYMSNYRKDNKEKLLTQQKQYVKKRKKEDVLFNLTLKLRTFLCSSFTRGGYVKSNKTEQILGCTFNEFKTHLESKWEPWMNWDNRGLYNGEANYGWDIDHIRPLSLAKTEAEVIKLNHYTNLQPLCSYINREIKKDKI